MELRDWQRRLDEHFTVLRNRRSLDAPDQPIFGLEHGLEDHEVSDLAKAVRAFISNQAPLWDHRLAWIVYAAEFGYLYSGDEYWQTFEEHTPGWETNGDRYWLRKCFWDFHERYGGAKPSGPWAQHFTIICWPITHAILPSDLQRQLSKILFELRHVFSYEALSTPRRLGELIAARSLRTSSRFQQLTQEPRFLGQIAAALLFEGDKLALSLILPSTLKRIGTDLTRERRSRAWMRDARESAKRRVQFQPIACPVSDRESQEQDVGETTNPRELLCLEPRLILRPSVEDTRWDVLLEIPDFSHVPAKYPQLKEVLLKSRCRVTGSSGRWKPGGWLLYGPNQIKLREWPHYDDQLIEFEQSIQMLDYLLQAECLLRPGSVWLFKIASDGLAYELRSAGVRAGKRYILLHDDTLENSAHQYFRQVDLNCDGITAVLLNLPEALTPELTEALGRLNLSHSGNIQIWPAGLAPSRWDGDGAAEWLSTEKPCVGVSADHYIETFSFELGTKTLEVNPRYTGEPVFVELTGLNIGLHTLSISACTEDGMVASETVNLDISIREPRVWAPGSFNQGALMVVVDPNEPTLEQIWEDQVEIELHGPNSRRMECTISLYKKGDSLPHLRECLPPLQLPVSGTAWRAHFNHHFKKSQDVQTAYDLAHTCELDFQAGDLGAFTLTAEREFSPLRWAARLTQSGYLLRLLDDSGAEKTVYTRFHKFEVPDIGRQLHTPNFLSRKGILSEGGLYLAQCADYHSAVIIPPEIQTFYDLRIIPQIKLRQRRPDDIIELLKLTESWAKARLTGNLSSVIMQQKVLSVLMQEVFRLIGGDQWASAERILEMKNDDQALSVVKRAISSKRDESIVSVFIVKEMGKLATMTMNERVKSLEHIAKNFLHIKPKYKKENRLKSKARAKGGPLIRRRADGPNHPYWLSEFALRLSSCPEGAADWAGDHLRDAISNLLEVPTLARAARFMVLFLARQQEPSAVGSCQLYNGWDW